MSLRIVVCAAALTQFSGFCQQNAAYKNEIKDETSVAIASRMEQQANVNGGVLAGDPYLIAPRGGVETEMQNSFAAVGNPAFPDFSPAAQAAFDERVMIDRYNRLARALNDFMGAYKAGQIDLKKAKAVRKALRDIEKVEWFKP